MSEYVIVIPAYNPPESFPPYVQALSKAGFPHILVVDDGSRKEFRPLFDVVSQVPGCEILRHAVNLGKGRALKNAINYCLNHTEFAGMITVDCDGQHTIEDVSKLRDTMEIASPPLILGCRDFDTPNVPPKSRFGNKLTCQVFHLLYGTTFSDTQTGLRGFSRETMQDFIDVPGECFEYETNMLIRCCRQKIPFVEVPIQTIYFNNNSETHFRPIADSLLIYKTIIQNFLLYSSCSILSFLLDILLFSVFFHLSGQSSDNIWNATLMARLCSSLFNFFMNKKFVFSATGSWKLSILKYYVLCILQLICSAGLVALAFDLFHVKVELLKMIVDSILSIFSYHIQRAVVFR